jgi:ubiquinone biosynthesis protein UbiJ
MNTTSPFFSLNSWPPVFNQPPNGWQEGQQRIVLLNHVLMQEKQTDRLQRQRSCGADQNGLSLIHRMPAEWWTGTCLTVYPSVVGGRGPRPRPSCSQLAGKPPLAIEGDVQLAAEPGWFAENLRWDVAGPVPIDWRCPGPSRWPAPSSFHVSWAQVAWPRHPES